MCAMPASSYCLCNGQLLGNSLVAKNRALWLPINDMHDMQHILSHTGIG